MDIDYIKSISGASFSKGKRIYNADDIKELKNSGRRYNAKVKGTKTYSVELYVNEEGNFLSCHCSCPAAEYQSICKHSVAVCFAIDAAEKGKKSTDSSLANVESLIIKSLTSNQDQEIYQLLKGLSKEELITELYQAIKDHESLFEKWVLKLEMSEQQYSLSDLKKRVTKAFPLKDIWHWAAVREYFGSAYNQVQLIVEASMPLKEDERWALLMRILERLNKVTERVDDSGGYRFDLLNYLYQSMSQCLTALDGSDEDKANMLHKLFHDNEFDICPCLDDFDITDQLKAEYLHKSELMLDAKIHEYGDLSSMSFDKRWPLQRLAQDLINDALAKNDKPRQCKLLSKIASTTKDWLDIAKICLTEQQVFDAEDYMLNAEKEIKTKDEKRLYNEFKVKWLLASSRQEEARELVWSLFNQKNRLGFFDVKKAIEIWEQREVFGFDESQLFNDIKVRLQPADEQSGKNKRVINDDLLTFYTQTNHLDKALTWVKENEYNASKEELIELSNKLRKENIAESIVLTKHAVYLISEHADKRGYQRSVNELKKLTGYLHDKKSQKLFENTVKDIAYDMMHRPTFVGMLKTLLPNEV